MEMLGMLGGADDASGEMLVAVVAAAVVDAVVDAVVVIRGGQAVEAGVELANGNVVDCEVLGW